MESQLSASIYRETDPRFISKPTSVNMKLIGELFKHVSSIEQKYAKSEIDKAYIFPRIND